MSYEHILVIIGLLTALSPFVGLPYAWLMVIFPVLGVLIVVLAFIIRARRKQRMAAEMPAPAVLHEETHGSF